MLTINRCGIDGCGRPARGKILNMCSMHYQRLRRTDSFDAKEARRLRPGERFNMLTFVEEVNGGRRRRALFKCDCGTLTKPTLVHNVFAGQVSCGCHSRKDPTATCEVDGCRRPRKGMGLCNLHYGRLRRTGDVHSKGRAANGEQSAWLRSFSAYASDDCLPWPYNSAGRGYGAVRYEGKLMSAPRAMCIEAHGSPPPDKPQASHSCGNGSSGCCNPRHLRWADQSSNEADKAIHDTSNAGTRNGQAKLNDDDVRAIYAATGQEIDRIIACRFGVSRGTVQMIRTGKRWAHVTGAGEAAPRSQSARRA